jgi:hypothetical protein
MNLISTHTNLSTRHLPKTDRLERSISHHLAHGMRGTVECVRCLVDGKQQYREIARVGGHGRVICSTPLKSASFLGEKRRRYPRRIRPLA